MAALISPEAPGRGDPTCNGNDVAPPSVIDDSNTKQDDEDVNGEHFERVEGSLDTAATDAPVRKRYRPMKQTSAAGLQVRHSEVCPHERVALRDLDRLTEITSMKEDSKQDVMDHTFLELFAGVAGLTAAVERAGGKVQSPLDAHDATYTRCTGVDLTKPSQVAAVLKLIKAGKVAWVHLAPPCSTFSKARMGPFEALAVAGLSSWD